MYHTAAGPPASRPKKKADLGQGEVINGRFASARLYKPDGANKIQSAEARGKALHQVPSTMQRLQRQDNFFKSALHSGRFLKICLLAYNRVVALKKKKKRQQFL